MSRSLTGFLVFCLLLGAAAAAVVWYVGPTLAGIVIDTERRERPYYLLALLPESATRAAAGERSYRARFASLAAEEGGAPVWLGEQAQPVEGTHVLDVAAAQLIEFDSGGSLVQLLTSSAYRDLRGAADAPRTRLLGTAVQPAQVTAGSAAVLVLYEHDVDAAEDAPLGAPGEAGWLKLVPRYGGALRWQADVDGIRDAAGWNRLLLIEFANAADARGWLDDAETMTERAIAGQYVDELAVLVLQPSGGR
ncbi:MAG: hypothetical protein ACODAC_06455 [Pseudomonadota bacterium]